MKNKLFKTLAIFGLSFIAWNCSEDPASSPAASSEVPTVLQPKQMLEVDQQSWLLNTGSQVFLIVPNGTGTYVVTDAFSIPVGQFNTATNTIVDAAGNPIVGNINLSTLAIVNPDKTITYPDGSKSDLLGNPISSGIVANSSSAAIPGPGVLVSSSSAHFPGNPTVSSSSAKTPNPVVSSSSQNTQKPVVSSSSQQQPKSSATSNQQCNGQCFDSASGKCVGYHDQQTGSKGEKYAYDESCKLTC